MGRYSILNSSLVDTPLPPKISLNSDATVLYESFYVSHREGVDTKEVLVSENEYPLREISVEEIIELRKTTIPSFVLKKNGHFYYTRIHKNMKFTNNMVLGAHLCGGCQHCSAAPDEKGGCPKVRNLDFSAFRVSKKNFDAAVMASKRIEKYDFILEGFESFNTSQESFVVTRCTNFESDEVRPPLSLDETNRRKLAVAQFVWPDVMTIGQMKRRYSQNKSKEVSTGEVAGYYNPKEKPKEKPK